MLSFVALVAFLAPSVLSQTALVDKRYPWPYAGPYKVDTSNGDRGPQTGYNQCNSTNAGQNSLCVNMVVNGITDFCFYAPPDPNSIIGNVEGECVAWCNTNKYNTRVIPSGAVTGALFVKTPGYLAMGLNVNGPLINVQASDAGGELDPHGADLRGNPIGALVYSNAFQGSSSGETQIYEWHEFISGQQICLKVCTPNNGDVQGNNNLCDNVHDTVGCNPNIPLPYDTIGTTFRQCLGANQLPPASNLGASIYTPPISQCTTYASSQIFGNNPIVISTTASSSSRSSSASSMSSISSSSSSSSSRSSSSSVTSLPPPIVITSTTTSNTITSLRTSTASMITSSSSVVTLMGAAVPTAAPRHVAVAAAVGAVAVAALR